eukprot:5204401-Prymnesium_polylepis.1
MRTGLATDSGRTSSGVKCSDDTIEVAKENLAALLPEGQTYCARGMSGKGWIPSERCRREPSGRWERPGSGVLGGGKTAERGGMALTGLQLGSSVGGFMSHPVKRATRMFNQGRITYT